MKQVAETDEGELVASATVAMSFPKSKLPAPFPTESDPQCYISNMAVNEKFRRSGLASALLHQAHRIGRWWGYEEVYLHFDAGNDGRASVLDSVVAVSLWRKR